MITEIPYLVVPDFAKQMGITDEIADKLKHDALYSIYKYWEFNENRLLLYQKLNSDTGNKGFSSISSIVSYYQ